MPWILIPFLFLSSFHIIFVNDAIQYSPLSSHILFIPVSIYLGLRYQQKGVITVGLGFILFLIPYGFFIDITENLNLFYLNGIVKYAGAYNNLSLYVLLILLSSVAAYFPDYLNKHNHTTDKTSPYMLFILLFFSLSIRLAISGDFHVYFNSIIFSYLYLFVYGVLTAEKKPYHVLLVIVWVHVLGLLFLNGIDANEFKINYEYKSLATILTMFFAYLVGKTWKRSLTISDIKRSNYQYIDLFFVGFLIVSGFYFPLELGQASYKYVFMMLVILYGIYKYIHHQKPNMLEVSIIVTLSIIIMLYAGGTITPVEPVLEGSKSIVHQSYILAYGSNGYLLMFLGLYLGIRYKKRGIILSIMLFVAALIINLMYHFEVKDLVIQIGTFKFVPHYALGHYGTLIFFTLLGYLSTNPYHNKVYYDKQMIISSSVKIIHRLWLFIVLFFPLLFILGLAIRGLNLDINIANDMYTNNVYFTLFIFVLIYLVIIYLPILISEGIVRRNGVIFNQANFPQYSEIHQLLDKDFGKERQALYIISPNKILLWGILTSRVFKIYAAMNPVLLSSVFNQITKDEEQLLFLTYKQYSKVKLGHVRLWWYMYIVTFIPVLNILYFYAKRVTYQNSLLYTFIELKNKNKTNIQKALDATVTEETEAGISNVSQHGIKINGVRNIFFLWLSYFVSRPHLQTQLYLLKAYNDKEDEVILKDTPLGYHFSFKDKSFKIDKYMTLILSLILGISIIVGLSSLQKKPIVEDIAPVEPIVEVPSIQQLPIISGGAVVDKYHTYNYSFLEILEAIQKWKIDTNAIDIKYANYQGGYIEPVLPLNPTEEDKINHQRTIQKYKMIEEQMHKEFVTKCINNEKYMHLATIKLRILLFESALIKKGFKSFNEYTEYNEKTDYKRLIKEFVGSTDIKKIKQYLAKENISAEVDTFIDELLKSYQKISNTPNWEKKFKKVTLDESTPLYDKYNKQGFPDNSDECFHTLIIYDDNISFVYESESTIDSWLYSFWYRRYMEGNMRFTKGILEWLDKKS